MRKMGLPGLRVAAIAVAAAAALPAAAGAAERYATPTGTGSTTCVSGDPCPIDIAVTGASSGDEVILVGGVPPAAPFETTTTLNVPVNVIVRGATGARPVVEFGPTTNGGFFLQGSSVLRDLNVEYEGVNGAAILIFTGTVERVFAHTVSGGASSAQSPCLAVDGGTIRDSVCWYESGSINGAGLDVFADIGDNFTATVRNVTAISETGQPGIRARNNFGAAVVNVTNSIADSSGGSDVLGSALGGAQNLSIVLDHSNYATESDPGGTQIEVTDPGSATNQTAAPAFVDAGNGDFHQTASSAATLNLGTATGLLSGELDLDGLVRSQGAAPDIGAYEFPVSALPPGGGGPSATPPPAKKKCKKGQKRVKGKCKKKKRKKKRK